MSDRLLLQADLPGHESCAWQVAWNPVRPLLASCSEDKTVRLYSYRRDPHDPSKLSFSFLTAIQTEHTKTIRSVAWSPSGKTLATGSFDSYVSLWEQRQDDEDEDEWEFISLLEGHETECKSVAYSATGTLLASCGRDRAVWIWEVTPDADYECMGMMVEHTEDVKSIAWHPTEEILASGSYDNTIKLYIDDEDGDWSCFATLSGHTSTVWSVAWAPRGDYLASCSDDRTIRIWRRTAKYAWECAHQLEGHARTIYAIDWARGKSDGLGWIASTGSDGEINVWDVSDENGTVSSKLVCSVSSGHGVYEVNSVRWCARGGFEDVLCTAADDGSVRIWQFVRA